jgi:hypothetical protein
VAYKTLVRQRRFDRTPVVSIQRGDQRMIRFARSGFSLSDTVIPERPRVSEATILASMLLMPLVPLVVLFFT